MFNLIERSRSFNAVAAGQTATVNMGTAGVYRSLLITYGTGTTGGANQANIEAEITEVRLVINGTVQRRFSAAELFVINGYHGEPFRTGVLPIFFAEPWRRTADGEDVLSWGMGDVDTFTVEVDIASGASSPTLSILSERIDGDVPMGPIVKWKRFTVPVTTTGEILFNTFPKTDAYVAMHCGSANITKVRIDADKRNIIEPTAAEMEHLAEKHGFIWQSNYFHIDFAYDRRFSSVLPMIRADTGKAVKDFDVTFKMGSAATFDLIAETFGLRD